MLETTLENEKSLLENNKNFALENQTTIDDEKTFSDEAGFNTTMENIAETLEKNIKEEISKINFESSIWEKINQKQFSDITKLALETTLKTVLKSKFKVKFSTFNDMKDTWNAVVDGNLKEALKKSSDAAIDAIKPLTSTVKTSIKKVKNAVIDKTIDSEKYEVINKQTKLINRISDNCQKFDAAIKINDATNIKKIAKAIEKDMNTILPIRETISLAQNVLDKYSLWKEKGEDALTDEEIGLIDKLNESA